MRLFFFVGVVFIPVPINAERSHLSTHLCVNTVASQEATSQTSAVFRFRKCQHTSGFQREWRRSRTIRYLPVPEHQQVHRGVQSHRLLDQ